MAVENDQIGGLTENDDVRRRALLRLGVAAVVTAAALAGLWWLDQSGGRKPEKPAPAALPSPIATAPLQPIAPPQTATDESAIEPAPEPETPAAPAIEPAPQASSPAAIPAGAPARRDPPPPPRVSNAPRSMDVPVSAPRSTPSPAPAPTPGGERFVLQMGVFSNPERARELVAKLHRQGIRAHMETRVHLGPFANREEAEQAQAQMRALGMSGLITPAFATK